ncbi:MAG: hypothetical protein MN733_21520, partial [Nitrososphaera sp.]|nr:hypothetical protein [Nitrososphaera sp.]
MNLLTFLFGQSRYVLASAIVTGIGAGILSVGLIGMLTTKLSGSGSLGTTLVFAYFACCLARLVFGIASQVLLISLVQGAVLNLRIRLLRKILGTDLPIVEKIGSNRLQNTLIDDIFSIASSLAYLPGLCISCGILLGCAAYIAV